MGEEKKNKKQVRSVGGQILHGLPYKRLPEGKPLCKLTIPFSMQIDIGIRKQLLVGDVTWRIISQLMIDLLLS